jgi:hypothetical protein
VQETRILFTLVEAQMELGKLHNLMSAVSTFSTSMKVPPDKALWSLVRYPMRAQPFHDRGYHITVLGCRRASQEEWAILKEGC